MSLKQLQPRHHAFIAAFRAQGWSNQTQAYVAAGFKSTRPDVHAARLAHDPLIRAEIERMQAIDRASAKTIDLESIRTDLLDARKRAVDRNDLNAELRASELLGKTIGAFTDRVETNAPQAGSDMEALTKLTALIVQALASAGALATSPNIAEQAIIAALQGQGAQPPTIQ